MPPPLAVVLGLFLVLVPGALLLALLSPEDRASLGLDEALFLAVGQSVALSAWLGLLLAEIGRFSMRTAGAVLATACVVGALLGRRRLGRPWRRSGSLRPLLPATLVLVSALALQARPSEYIVGGRDPGAYVAAMGIVARSGHLAYTDPVVLSVPEQDVSLFFRHPDKPRFSWSRFMGFDLESPRSGRVFPQFFHLFPAFGAYLFQSMGLKGALGTPCVFGVLGALGAFFTFRRLFGEPTALLAALLLNLNVLQVWFGRYPVSEGMSQFLIFLGLFAFALWEERGSTAFGALAGAAFGLTLLVRIDSVLVVLPIGLFVAVRRAQRALDWKAAAPLLVPFLLLAAHAAAHGLLFAPKYVEEILNRPYWRLSPAAWVALLALGLAALWVADRLGPAIVARCAPRARLLRRLLIVALVLLAAYAYFLRPYLSAWAGGDGNLPGTALARDSLLRHWLQALGFRRLAAHDAQALLRLGWMLSPLGLLLGLLGLVQVLRRHQPRLLFPLLLAATLSGFYLYKIRVFNDYPFAFRRFLPVAVPFILALAARFLVGLWSRGTGRRLLASLLLGGLVVSFAQETRKIATYVDWRGSVGFVREIARRFGPEDVVIFEQPKSVHLLSLPLWAAYGVNIVELARFNPDPERLQHLVETWRHQYRNIYFVHTYRTDLCGLFLQHLASPVFFTTEWYAYNRRPEGPEIRSLQFSLSRVVPPAELKVPPLPEVDIGRFDDFQVSGFYDKEGGEERRYRWTGTCGSVYLPGARGKSWLSITTAAQHRPNPAPVTVSLSGIVLGRLVAGAEWRTYTFALPSTLPDPLVLRLDVPAWRPINVLPGSDDPRDLGVMVDRIEVGDGAAFAGGRIPPPELGGEP
jgi:hypothetical protein